MTSTLFAFGLCISNDGDRFGVLWSHPMSIVGSPVTERRGQTDQSATTPDHRFEAMQEASQMPPSFIRDKGVKLVDNNVAKIAKHGLEVGVSIDKGRFQRLRCDEKYSLWVLGNLSLSAAETSPCHL